MKYSIIITFLSFATLTNCSLKSDDELKEQVHRTYWHLTNISGGFAGVNNDFDLNKIIWAFDEDTSELIVNNTNTEEVEDGFDSGTYSFSVTNNSENYFLSIENNEFGAYSITENQLIIDQNITTSGLRC